MKDQKPATSQQTSHPDRGQNSTLIPLLVCALLISLGAIFFVWQRYQYVRLGFEVAELRREKARLETTIEPLIVEVEYLSRLERIDKLAREKLGMRAPQPNQVLVLEKDGSSSAASQ